MQSFGLKSVVHPPAFGIYIEKPLLYQIRGPIHEICDRLVEIGEIDVVSICGLV
jgi:hypothetical protein